MLPVGDVKGHVIGVLSRGGLALFENDEVANQSAVMSFESTLGKGGTFEVYTTITFSDGSSWIFKSTGSMERTPDQKKLLTKQTGEFLKVPPPVFNEPLLCISVDPGEVAGFGICGGNSADIGGYQRGGNGCSEWVSKGGLP